MAFVDKMRMQNIFPSSKFNLGFTGKIPAYGGNDPLTDIVSRFKDLRTEEESRIPQIANRMAQPMGQTQDATNPNQGRMNVVFKEDMTPFQKESLALRRMGLENTKGNQEANRDLTKQRISIAEHKAKNPNKRFIAVKGGNVMAFDPATGEAEDTGINSGTLSDAERAELTKDNQLEVESTRQGNRLEIVNTQHGNRMTEKQYEKDNPDDDWGNPVQTFNPDGTPGLVIQVNNKDGSTRRVQAGGSIKAPPTIQPSQQINARKLKIQEILNRKPEWRRYVDAETGEVKPVGTGFGSSDLTADMRNQIVNEIFGDAGNAPPQNPPPGDNSQTTTPGNTALPPVEQRKMNEVYTLPNGRKGKWNGKNFTAVQE
jgi:hypothetical protein